MSETNEVKIKHNEHGCYYELYLNGVFAGNYDTATEAADEAGRIIMGEDGDSP